MKSSINKSLLMKTAHLIASTLEGNYSARLKEALKMAWKGARKAATKLVDMAKWSAKEVFNAICAKNYGGKFNNRIEWTENAEHILNVVAENSLGFQADIADRALEGNNISDKQVWCVAFEFLKVA